MRPGPRQRPDVAIGSVAAESSRVTPITLVGQNGHYLCAHVHKDIACIRRGGPGTYGRPTPRSSRRSIVATGRTHRPATRSRGIPEATVARLPLYLRALCWPSERRVPTFSSEHLALSAAVISARLPMDLSSLASYGTCGMGYDV